MRKGEAVAAFANRFQGLIPDKELIKYHFIHKLLNEVQTLRAFNMYEEEKSFDEITEACHKLHKRLMHSCGNKRPRTQVNAIGDEGEEEEEPENGEHLVHLVSNDTSRRLTEKRARMDQAPESVAANAAFVGLCRPHQQFGARAWRCLGNGCLLEKWPGFLTKRGPQSGQGRGQGNGRG